MGQLKYVLKRLFLMFFTLFVIVAICFMMIRLLPQEMPQEKNMQEIIKEEWSNVKNDGPGCRKFIRDEGYSAEEEGCSDELPF